LNHQWNDQKKNHCSFIFGCITILGLFLSCSGYHFRNLENPLEQYDIQSISIPMFQNRSSLPNVAGAFAKEITLLMQSFPQLKVYSGEEFSGDAVLIGIIESAPLFKDVVSGTGDVVLDFHPDTQTGYSSLAGRKTFRAYSKANVQLSLRLILIKNPTRDEMELFRSDKGLYFIHHPKVIFHETLSLSREITRDLQNQNGPDSAAVVNFTKSKASLDLAIRNMAKESASQFKEVILYAF
jgi:hypothetical protein